MPTARAVSRVNYNCRLHVARSKTDQTAEGAVLYLGPTAVDALLAIRPQEAVIDPGARVFRTVGPTNIPKNQGGH